DFFACQPCGVRLFLVEDCGNVGDRARRGCGITAFGRRSDLARFVDGDGGCLCEGRCADVALGIPAPTDERVTGTTTASLPGIAVREREMGEDCRDCQHRQAALDRRNRAQSRKIKESLGRPPDHRALIPIARVILILSTAIKKAALGLSAWVPPPKV